MLWFNDGSVVVVAESTGFRVHSSLLSRHSTVFRDLFSLPQPIHAAEHVDGCPAVRVSDDAEDMAYFLRAIYDGRQYVYPASFSRVDIGYLVSDIT